MALRLNSNVFKLDAHREGDTMFKNTAVTEATRTQARQIHPRTEKWRGSQTPAGDQRFSNLSETEGFRT